MNKEQLKQIIKEEIIKTLNEQTTSFSEDSITPGLKFKYYGVPGKWYTSSVTKMNNRFVFAKDFTEPIPIKQFVKFINNGFKSNRSKYGPLQYYILLGSDGKAINEESYNWDDVDYSTLGPAARFQKSFDRKYRAVMEAVTESGELDAYMNRDNSLETPGDYKEFNQGAIEYFTELVKDLKMVNAKIK